MNKKGLSTLQLFAFIFISFFIVMFLGLGVWGFNLVYDNLALDVDVGQTNLKNITDATFGKVNSAFTQTADTIAVVLLLGMAIVMILSGYVLGEKYPKIMIGIDIIILVFCFIVSIYISQTFDTYINSNEYFTLYADNLPKSSAMILNLPYYIGVIGVLIMIFSYAITKPREETSVYGY